VITAGVHPTRAGLIDANGEPQQYMDELLSLIQQNPTKIVAIGECGLGK
jgi:Tat protein secretion system quality control protein TatD with DNase activity